MSNRNMKVAKRAIGVLLFISVNSAIAETVSIFTWPHYFGEQTIAQFEAETGHKIQLSYFDNDTIRDRTTLVTYQSDYDLIVFEQGSLQRFGQNGFFHDLEDLAIRHRENQKTEYANSCGKWGEPYGWGTIGIAYRTSAYESLTPNWMTLFRPPEAFDKHIVMPLNKKITTAALLYALGEDIETENHEILAKANQLLIEQIPHLMRYGSGLSYVDSNIVESDMTMTLAYSSSLKTISNLSKQDDWSYVIPEEGGMRWLNCLGIPSERPVSQATIDFLSFLNLPEIAAQNAEEVGHSTTNEKAESFLSKPYLDNEVVNPGSEELERSPFIDDISYEGMRLRNWLIESSIANYNRSQGIGD